MTDEQIAEIAGNLTEAQKQAILRTRHLVKLERFFGPASALHALKRKGLSTGPFADQPTPLGLAVRNYLENSRGTG